MCGVTNVKCKCNAWHIPRLGIHVSLVAVIAVEYAEDVDGDADGRSDDAAAPAAAAAAVVVVDERKGAAVGIDVDVKSVKNVEDVGGVAYVGCDVEKDVVEKGENALDEKGGVKVVEDGTAAGIVADAAFVAFVVVAAGAAAVVAEVAVVVAYVVAAFVVIVAEVAAAVAVVAASAADEMGWELDDCCESVVRLLQVGTTYQAKRVGSQGVGGVPFLHGSDTCCRTHNSSPHTLCRKRGASVQQHGRQRGTLNVN